MTARERVKIATLCRCLDNWRFRVRTLPIVNRDCRALVAMYKRRLRELGYPTDPKSVERGRTLDVVQ